MPLPRTLARANRYVTNPIARRLAGRVPPFALVGHTGRRSGTRYWTPVMVFRAGDDWTIALTYGVATEWVKNVQAANGGTVRYRGREIAVTDPRIVRVAEVAAVPGLVQIVLRIVGAEWALVVRGATG